MAYTKTTWVNGTTPAVNATNLNKIEQGIADAHDMLTTGGTTSQRPSNPKPYQPYFDTTIEKPIWWDGSAWKDANGTTV